MPWTAEISFMIMAICALLLVIFAIVTAIYLIQFVLAVKKMTERVELKINPLLDEARNIVNITSDTSNLIKTNIDLTTPLFRSLGKVSGLMEDIPSQLKEDISENTTNVNCEARKKKFDIGEWTEWLALGAILVQKFRNK